MSRNFSNANTGVFWDVEDYPIPNDYDPVSIHQNIKSAITDKGFRKLGMVDLRGYGEKNKIWDQFLVDGITVVPAGDKCRRVRRMILDILFWALDNPSEYYNPQNVMVISKNMSEDKELLSVLQILEWRRYNVLLSDSDNVESLKQLPFVSYVWFSKNLLDGEYPIDQSGFQSGSGSESESGSSHGDGAANKRKQEKKPSNKLEQNKKSKSESSIGGDSRADTDSSEDKASQGHD